jgi:carbon-monoxide dehydrogenase large subunit
MIRIAPTGKVQVFIGESPHGQGEKTTFAQVTADQLGVPYDDVEIIAGDTANTPMGWGTYGSRTTTVGGGAIFTACGRLIEKGKKIAAHLLEAAEADIVFNDGRFSIKGSPDRMRTIQDVTLQATLAWNLPAGVEPGMEAIAFYDPPNFVYPFGAHVCTVEVDPNTGETALLRYVAVDDCGKVINPLIVDGQVHGGITQGLAQALLEEAVYDENGQMLTASMLDYAVPKAFHMPRFETAHTVTPSPHHPLGVKGVGETGTIASTATVANAIIDALSPLGITHLDMPFTPRRLWHEIQVRKGGRP